MRGLRAPVLACLLPLFALAQEAPEAPAPAGAGFQVDALPKLPAVVWNDTVTLVQAPGAWTSRQWSEAALGLAAVVSVGLVLDHTVDRSVVRNRKPSWDTPAKDIAQLGGTGGLLLIGGGYLGSSLLGMDEARSLWTDAGIATLLSQVAIFPVKMAVGRIRPADNEGSGEFRPFSSSSADAFPSGHATQAFAIASVVSLHADNPWVSAGAYGLAGLVGLSRLETRDHFASDVVAGALIGTTIGHAVVHIDQTRRFGAGGRAELSFSPAWSPDFRGIRMVAKF